MRVRRLLNWYLPKHQINYNFLIVDSDTKMTKSLIWFIFKTNDYPFKEILHVIHRFSTCQYYIRWDPAPYKYRHFVLKHYLLL